MGEIAGNGAAGNAWPDGFPQPTGEGNYDLEKIEEWLATQKGETPKGEAAALAVRTLRGDLRDWVLDQIRNLPKPWHQMLESEQRDFAFLADEVSTRIVAKAVDLIAADGRRVLRATVEAVKIGTKAIEAKLVVSRQDEERLLLVDAQGERVMVVLTDPERFLGERGAPRVDPEQPPLPLQAPKDEAEALADALKDGFTGGPDGDALLRARELGRQARLHGHDREKNLYEPGTPEATAWLEGWDAEAAAWGPARYFPNLAAERAEAEKDPFAAGKAAALHGFNETRNPFNDGTESESSAEWLRGHAYGESQRLAAHQTETSGKRRRRRRPPADQPEA